MKRWALLVAGLYVIVFITLTTPLLVAAFWPDASFGSAGEVYEQWVYWLLIPIVFMLQVSLLVVPVEQARQRPLKRRHVGWLVGTGLVLMLALGIALYMSIYEVLEHTPGNVDYVPIMGPLILAWAVWIFLFGFYTARANSSNIVSRVTRWLIAGSILELLVAVPCHVIARSRDYCCAGFATFVGLATGLSVMLLAFGPAVFVLAVRRWQSIRPNQRIE